MLNCMQPQEHNGVISRLDLAVDGGVELCQAIGQGDRTLLADRDVKAGKARFHRPGELARGPLMVIS